MIMKMLGLARLTKDVEVRYSSGAQPMAIATFSIASPRKFRREGEPEADFFDCVAFGGKAEFIGKFFHKGSRVYIEGEERNDNYVNKEGIKVYRNRLYVTEIDFADNKGDGTTTAAPAQTAQAQAPVQAQQRTVAAPAQTRQATAPKAPAQTYAQAPAPAPAAPAQAPAKRTTTRKAAAPAQTPAQAPAQDGFMAIPEGMENMPFFN